MLLPQKIVWVFFFFLVLKHLYVEVAMGGYGCADGLQLAPSCESWAQKEHPGLPDEADERRVVPHRREPGVRRRERREGSRPVTNG